MNRENLNVGMSYVVRGTISLLVHKIHFVQFVDCVIQSISRLGLPNSKLLRVCSCVNNLDGNFSRLNMSQSY